MALDHKFKGLVDVSAVVVDGIDSYLDDSFGKLRYNDGEALSLGQATLVYEAAWDSGVSVHAMANAYADENRDAAGFTEAFIQYRSLPTSRGYRFRLKGGMFYPAVSQTNFLVGWSSPYTTTYSAINSWIAEEVRHHGVEASFTRLGKFHDSEHDFSLSASAFQGNDTAGALMAWHGWTSTNRQTLRQENSPIPNPVVPFKPVSSEVFVELDDRTGTYFTAQWRWHRRMKMTLGRYDNNAIPYIVEDLQYAWHTRFNHIGVRWRLPFDSELIVQHLEGDTLMRSSDTREIVVKNDFQSTYVMLSKRHQGHRLSLRLEEFSVTDKEVTPDDDNNEYGKAATLAFQYRVAKHYFLIPEYHWIRSRRPSRQDVGLPLNQTECQYSFTFRAVF